MTNRSEPIDAIVLGEARLGQGPCVTSGDRGDVDLPAIWESVL